jgi:radical SAM superfamily enzyme YgiQ (UPF0313 family)
MKEFNISYNPRNDEVKGWIELMFASKSISKFLFIVPPDADADMFNYSTAKRKRYWNFPPYGAGILASHLRLIGVDVQILNLNNFVLKECQKTNNENEFDFDGCVKSEITKKILGYAPDFIGVSCMFSQTHKSTIKVVNLINEVASNIPVGLGGVHVTNSLVDPKTVKTFLEDFKGVDVFFTYEAELSLKKFVLAVNQKCEVSELGQLILNDGKKQLNIVERLIPTDHDLNIIPAFDLMEIDKLSVYGKIGSFYSHLEPGVLLATSLVNKGCRAQCTFCSVRNFNGVGVRSRSISSVIDELKILKYEYGINHVMWLDDDFLKGTDRTLNLFNEMIRQKLDMTWDCTNGVIASSCTDEIIAAAADSGCIGLNIGMESGNKKILRDIKKPGNPDTFLKAAEVIRKYEKINARVFLMLGFPGESYEMIFDTIELSRKMNLDWYNVTILQPLPNTPIFDAMLEQGYLNIEDVEFGDIRYNSGAYGKHRKKAEEETDLLASDFKDAFKYVDMSSIPTRSDLDQIWAYMNYHLNFKPLFDEKRPSKLLQKLQYVTNISDVIAPENAIAMYFQGFLQHSVHGVVEPSLVEELKLRLNKSPYWAARFIDFGLDPNQLNTLNFPINK